MTSPRLRFALLTTSVAALAQAAGGQAIAHAVAARAPTNDGNRWLPLRAGTVYRYHANTGKAVTVRVLSSHRSFQGHSSVAVDTKELVGGRVNEHFVDWYWRDRFGTVWHMAHSSARAGESWQAGRHGARRGILLKAQPKVGDRYGEEFAPGIAEDRATVASVSGGRVRLDVTSPLYPETIRFTYKAGTGLVQVRDKGEVQTLTSVQP